MTARFGCDVQTAEDSTCLRLEGELDLSSAPMLRTCLSGLIEAGARHVVVDVGALRFVDASGIRAIAAEARRLRQAGGEMVLRNPRPWTRRLFGLLGAAELVTIEQSDDVDDDAPVIDLRPARGKFRPGESQSVAW